MSAPIPAFRAHDHSCCTGDVLAKAEALAKSQNLRLTPVRRRVLEILVEEHRALGAYEILDRLKSDGFASQPPVAYRALDFLVEHGLAHRIRRLNAFAACMSPDQNHAPAFLICEGCDAVAELPATAAAEAFISEAQMMGFEVSRMNIEAVGRCPACREA